MSRFYQGDGEGPGNQEDRQVEEKQTGVSYAFRIALDEIMTLATEDDSLQHGDWLAKLGVDFDELEGVIDTIREEWDSYALGEPDRDFDFFVWGVAVGQKMNRENKDD